MQIQFDIGSMLIALVPSQNTEESGAFELYFREHASRRAGIKDMKDTDLCPGFIIDLFKDYYLGTESWPLTPEMLLQRLEEEGRKRLGAEERNIIADKIRQVIDLQNQVRTLYIANMPESLYHMPYVFRYILHLLKELQSVQVCENKCGFFSKDGILYFTDEEGCIDDIPEYDAELILCPPVSPLTEIRLDKSIKSIARNAFMGNKNLVQIESESQNFKIFEFAFRGAESLETVRIGGKHVEIQDRAFLGCHALKHCMIHRGSIIHCPDTAFDSETPFYQELLTEWVEDSGYRGVPGDVAVFGRCGDTAWRYKDRENTEHVIGHGEMWDFDNNFWTLSPDFESRNLIIHDGITALGAYAFCRRDYETVTFAESIREIREGAFFATDCVNITLPGTIKYIGKKAFWSVECYTKRIEISSAIEQIEAAAFRANYEGPSEVVLTGENPPEDWYMWMRSDLFVDEATVTYFPEKWRNVMTEEYFNYLLRVKRAPELPEEKESFYDYSYEDRCNFFYEMERALLQENNTGRFRWK